METFLHSFLENIEVLPLWSILMFLFFSGILQVLIAPYPGEIIVVFAGYLGSTKLLFVEILLFCAYWLAILLCNFIIYELGKKYGDKILQHRLVAKYFPENKKEKISSLVTKYSFFVYVISIFTPGLYLPIILFCSIIGHKRSLAYSGMIVATLIHDVLLFICGGVIGKNWSAIKSFLMIYNRGLLIILALAVIVLTTVYFVKLKSKKLEKA